MCVCEGERAEETEYVLSVHKKSVNLWQKHKKIICRFYPIVYYICLASVVVGFGSFAVVGCKESKDL